MAAVLVEKDPAPPAEESTGRWGRRWPVLTAVLIVVALMAGFAAGWRFGPEDADDGDVVSQDVRDLHEQWVAAWNAEDGDAVVSLMMPSGRHYCPATGTAGVSGDELASFVERGWQMTDVEIVSVTSSPASAVMGHVGHDYVVVSELTLNGRPGYLSVLHLAATDGALRVHQHMTYP